MYNKVGLAGYLKRERERREKERCGEMRCGGEKGARAISGNKAWPPNLGQEEQQHGLEAVGRHQHVHVVQQVSELARGACAGVHQHLRRRKRDRTSV